MLLDRSHREFFWLFVRRDFKIRYAGSTLGSLWNLIHPLVMVGIYMTIFSSLMPSKFGTARPGLVDYGTLDYGVSLCAGLLPWLVFSDVIMRSVSVLNDNGNFLQKISFPPIVLFLAVLFNALVIYGIGYLAFLTILVALGKAVPAAALATLGVMLLLGVCAMGLGLVLAGLNVFFRDTAQVMAVLMQLLFWFNPIVYRKELFFKPVEDAAGRTWLEQLGYQIILWNPFERFISASQRLIGSGSIPLVAVDWAIIFIFPFVCLGTGLYLHRRMMPDVRDCL